MIPYILGMLVRDEVVQHRVYAEPYMQLGKLCSWGGLGVVMVLMVV